MRARNGNETANDEQEERERERETDNDRDRDTGGRRQRHDVKTHLEIGLRIKARREKKTTTAERNVDLEHHGPISAEKNIEDGDKKTGDSTDRSADETTEVTQRNCIHTPLRW